VHPPARRRRRLEHAPAGRAPLSARTRRALIERPADTDTLIAPAHFASPSVGRIVSRRGAFTYRLAGEA
jgi:hypothetical protein